MVTPTLMSALNDDSGDVLVVTLKDRFPASHTQQQFIAESVYDALSGPLDTETAHEAHVIQREPIERLASRAAAHGMDFGAACREQYGQNCHVAGGITADGRGHLLVVRSQREDDTSKPALEARKAAAKQLPRDRMGVIALQYEEIEVQDLSKPAFRRRLALLDNYLFHDDAAQHVGAIYHCAFAGLWKSEGRLGKPAFVSWAPRWRDAATSTPFDPGISNSRFAHILAAKAADSDDHLYGLDL
jgi:hypothetical protein